MHGDRDRPCVTLAIEFNLARIWSALDTEACRTICDGTAIVRGE
jgi:hypothetical protein